MNVRMTPRVALVLIAALFILPLLLAWLMYAGVIDLRPESTRNLGQLVQPPAPLDWAAADLVGEPGDATDLFDRHWVLLHALPDPCDTACEQAVVGLRQIHRAAGRDQARVRLALLRAAPDSAPSERLHSIYGELHVLDDPRDELGRTLAGVARAATRPGTVQAATFVVDPLGNVMMYYAPGTDPNDIKTDLERLLRWSKQDQK